MASRVAAASIIVVALLCAPAASATPVFDCTDPHVRQEYPYQCPQLGDPLLTGGGGGATPGGGGSGGILGTIGKILGGLTGGLL
jgi:hypothetical protein